MVYNSEQLKRAREIRWDKYRANKNAPKPKLSVEAELERDLKLIERTEKAMKESIGNKKADKFINKIENKFSKYNLNIKAGNTKYKNNRTLEITIGGDRFNGTEKLSRDFIKNAGKYIGSTLSNLHLNGKIQATTDFGFSYKAGQAVNFGDITTIYDPSVIGSGGGDEYDKMKDFKQVKYYINIDNRRNRRVGKDYNNDCLYNCLNKVIPSLNPFKSPDELKRFFKVELSEMVELSDENIKLLDNKLKNVNIGLNITGDIIYTSPHNLNRNVYLKVSNNHINVNHNANSKAPIISFKERKIIIQDKTNKLGYNPDFGGEFEITNDFLHDVLKFKTDYIFVERTNERIPDESNPPQKRFKTNEEEYNDYIKIADDLKRETNGRINLYKTGSIRNTALSLFDELTKHLNPEELLEDEAIWITESTKGALIFNDKYEGTVYKYDVKSRYPSILESLNILVPLKRGEFKILTKEEFNNLKFFPHGIFRCIITPSDNYKINRLFRFNVYNKYTTHDLNCAKELGLKIELIEDSTVNCLLYPSGKSCIKSVNVFKPYCEYLYPLKEKGIKGAKLLLNILSGCIGELNKKTIYVDELADEPIEIDENLKIISQKPSVHNENETIVKVIDPDNYFKSKFARFKPFMLAKARQLHALDILPNIDYVVKCHTDSIISTIDLSDKLDIGNKIGQYNYEGKFDVIINSNAKEKIIKKYIN
jgi:hypothetical protein